eukprot:TRINITY_DN71127_c0_g1_i1.p1 TRINITY_DN71127_c0_g1~~TRINITY_DN71127_c0_g1_i1.p1  ORF type:complete len:399 (+),score=27.17 TRINITY_DN71127_c0_g1_i1:169-1365(+)
MLPIFQYERMTSKLAQVLFQFMTTGGIFGLCSYTWGSADFWRKYKVKKYLLSQKRTPSYDLPKFDQENLNQCLNVVLQGRDPLLIDGPSGAGKTTTVKKLVHTLSTMTNESGKKRYATAYLCLRTVNPEKMTVSLANQFHYVGKGANHDHVDQALDCLRDVIRELYVKKGIKTKVFLDDIDRAFEYNKPPTHLGKSLVAELGLRLSDMKAGRVIFITSDNFVFGEMRKIGGVEKRLEYFPFPTVSEDSYIKYIKANSDFFKQFAENPEEDFRWFYKVFGSNMRSIENFINSKKAMSTFLKMRIGGEKNGLCVTMKDREAYNVMHRIARGELVLEDDPHTGPSTNNLVMSRILRITWSPKLTRSHFTPATPLIMYSLQELLNEGYFDSKFVHQRSLHLR